MGNKNVVRGVFAEKCMKLENTLVNLGQESWMHPVFFSYTDFSSGLFIFVYLTWNVYRGQEALKLLMFGRVLRSR